MNDNERTATVTRIRRIYSLVLSVIIMLTGIAFIISCAHLYFTGGDVPYSRERVGEYLSRILIISVLCIVGVIGGAVLSLIDRSTKKEKTVLSASRLLKIAKRRFDPQLCKSEDLSALDTVKRTRHAVYITAAVVSAVLIGVAIALAVLIPEHNIATKDRDVVKALLLALPSTVITLGLVYSAMSVSEALDSRELEIIKRTGIKTPELYSAPENKALSRSLLLARIVVLALGVLFVVLGIFNGGAGDVLNKAVAICTECIGLG